MLLVRKVAGIPRVCDFVLIVVVGRFIISLYDSNSEEWCFSIAKMYIKKLNRWFLLLRSEICPSLVFASSTQAINHTDRSWSCSMSDISFLLLSCCIL